MLFNSYQFLIFFPIVIALYFALPKLRFRIILLLCTSYYFYMCWRPEYVILIIASTLINYISGILIGRANSHRLKKAYLIFSLCVNLGLLFTFKYFNFFNNSLRFGLDFFGITNPIPAFKLLLPIGISFYTFQILSYIIDVYRGKTAPETGFFNFALYVSFFPQLVAGPIERAKHLLPQFCRFYNFNYQRVADGLKLIVWGLFKKVVIADRLAIYVNHIYGRTGEFSSWSVLLAVYFFAFQIYCDFSGYSDIAIGAAQVMGFNLMDNFKRPYFAKSIAEFWRRWHISLTTWFRDYIYIPLGGNRCAFWRWQINLIIIFLISGLWHGAAWTFVLWGALHGVYLMISNLTVDLRKRSAMFIGLDLYPRLHKYLKIFITFHLVVFSWILFRADNLRHIGIIFKKIFSFDLAGNRIWSASNHQDWFIVCLSLIFLLGVQLLQRQCNMRQFLSAKPVWFKLPVYFIIILAIILFGKFSSQDFIYFQF